MRLLLTSDTHIATRAGDWIDEATLDLLESRSRRLIGV